MHTEFQGKAAGWATCTVSAVSVDPYNSASRTLIQPMGWRPTPSNWSCATIPLFAYLLTNHNRWSLWPNQTVYIWIAHLHENWSIRDWWETLLYISQCCAVAVLPRFANWAATPELFYWMKSLLYCTPNWELLLALNCGSDLRLTKDRKERSKDLKFGPCFM